MGRIYLSTALVNTAMNIRVHKRRVTLLREQAATSREGLSSLDLITVVTPPM